MTSLIMLMSWMTVALVTLGASSLTAQQDPGPASAPPIQNAQVGTGSGSPADVIASLGQSAEPVWVAWRAPMVTGDRDRCSTWSNDRQTVRGEMLEGTRPGSIPAMTTAAGPVALESGTSLVVLVRVVGGTVERVRSVTDDCPLDAGGRRVIWLPAVTSAASLAFLGPLVSPSAIEGETGRRISSAALSTIALHRDSGADRILDGLLTARSDEHLRTQAATLTARTRGGTGYRRIVSLLETERDAAFRRTLSTVLAETREPETLAALLALARADQDERVRAEAARGYAWLAPSSDLAEVRSILTRESSQVVIRGVMRGLSRRTEEGTTALLVDLARRSTTSTVRVEAARALSQSSDPVALAYLQDVLKQ